MEYQKMINLLDNRPNQLSKFRTKNWIEINDQSRRVYDIVMPMSNSVKHNHNYSEISGRLWQYYKDELNDNLTDSKFKSKIKAGNSPADGNTKDVKISVPLKYLSNFWRTPEMPSILIWVEGKGKFHPAIFCWLVFPW